MTAVNITAVHPSPLISSFSSVSIFSDVVRFSFNIIKCPFQQVRNIFDLDPLFVVPSRPTSVIAETLSLLRVLDWLMAMLAFHIVAPNKRLNA